MNDQMWVVINDYGDDLPTVYGPFGDARSASNWMFDEITSLHASSPGVAWQDYVYCQPLEEPREHR